MRSEKVWQSDTENKKLAKKAVNLEDYRRNSKRFHSISNPDFKDNLLYKHMPGAIVASSFSYEDFHSIAIKYFRDNHKLDSRGLINFKDIKGIIIRRILD